MVKPEPIIEASRCRSTDSIFPNPDPALAHPNRILIRVTKLSASYINVILLIVISLNS